MHKIQISQFNQWFNNEHVDTINAAVVDLEQSLAHYKELTGIDIGVDITEEEVTNAGRVAEPSYYTTTVVYLLFQTATDLALYQLNTNLQYLIAEFVCARPGVDFDDEPTHCFCGYNNPAPYQTGKPKKITYRVDQQL